LLMSVVTSILFLGGWLAPFSFLGFIPGCFWLGLKVGTFAILFVVIRAVLPRYRYDQLMQIGWKIFIPVTLGWLLFIAGIIIAFNSLPGLIYF
jgi:NADH-quinone oxidoreductase subunit H